MDLNEGCRDRCALKEHDRVQEDVDPNVRVGECLRDRTNDEWMIVERDEERSRLISEGKIEDDTVLLGCHSSDRVKAARHDAVHIFWGLCPGEIG